VKRRVARNRCTACGREWSDLPIGFARHDRCPACGSFYWQWLNYEEDAPQRSSRAVNLLRARRNETDS
jgi:hypothetical protein